MVCIFDRCLRFEFILDSWVGSDYLLFWLMIRSLRFLLKEIISESDCILKNCVTKRKLHCLVQVCKSCIKKQIFRRFLKNGPSENFETILGRCLCCCSGFTFCVLENQTPRRKNSRQFLERGE